MNGPCEEFADKIVDYVDGELPEEEVQAVTLHLAECERCRQAAGALERSLGLAKVIWSDNLGDSRSSRVRRSTRVWTCAVAASILVAGSILALIVSNHSPRQPSICAEDVEEQIVRTGAAAELLAATQILTQCEGTETLVKRQYQFILQEYAGTPAAESIRAQYGSRLGDIQ